MKIRTLGGLVAAALLALPVAAHAQSANRHAARPWGGLALGVETGDLDGFQLRGDLEYPVQRMAPQLVFAFVGSLNWSHLSEHSVDLDELGFTPTARFLFEATPTIDLYGDLGLGLYYANLDWDTGDDSDVGLMMKLGVGVGFEVSPTVRLGGELGFRPHFGDYDDTTTSLLFTALFRL
ncbi:MAG: outer membrane beta-barrel protein [Anaeromyxobacter sp.]